MFQTSSYELRTRTARSPHTGPVATIRIMKGLRYRVRSYQTHRVTADELTWIGQATGYVTNKRFILRSAEEHDNLVRQHPCPRAMQG